MKKKLILSIICCVLSALTIKAQGRYNDLTQEQIEQLQERIVDKLEDFLDFLSMSADKRNQFDVRQKAYQSNLLLFIGECEKYEEFSNGLLKYHDPVKMETSSLYRSKPRIQSMKNYLNNILNNHSYANIEIEQNDAIYVSDVRKQSDGRYVAKAVFRQVFRGLNDNGLTKYSDITEKSVDIIIDHKLIPTSLGYEDFWDIKIGDMKVLETKRI